MSKNQKPQLNQTFMWILFICMLTFLTYLIAAPFSKSFVYATMKQHPDLQPSKAYQCPPASPSNTSEMTTESPDWIIHQGKMKANIQTLFLVSSSKIKQTIGSLTELIEDAATNNGTNNTQQLQDIKTGLQGLTNTMNSYISSYLQELQYADNTSFTWQQTESRELVNIVQNRIYKVMNPASCKEKFFCDFSWVCGFGCTLHHILYCATMSMMYGRPLVLLDKSWKYGRWETLLKPISPICSDHNVDVSKIPVWKGDPSVQNAKLTHLNKVNYDPMKTIPDDVAPRLTRFHGNPLAWWVGQLMKYLLRPQEVLSNFTSEVVKRTGFTRPVAGIHVRRTDKIKWEAKAYDIRLYMNAVEEYFDWRELTEKIDKRRVYIATDEPKVVEEAKQLYPHYEILNDKVTMAGAVGKTRFSTKGLKSIITDLQLLSDCDYVVCTFSSNIGRAVYELMQAKNVDASLKCRSLDYTYYFYQTVKS